MDRRTYWKLWWQKLRFNLYPPYLLSRTRCVFIAPDYRHARFRLTLCWLNRNLNGSLFGGTLYALADPVHAVLLSRLLPGGPAALVVWAKAARIEFLLPARGTVSADYRITDADLAAMSADLAAAGKSERDFTVAIVDTAGKVVAQAEVTVYVRRRR